MCLLRAHTNPHYFFLLAPLPPGQALSHCRVGVLPATLGLKPWLNKSASLSRCHSMLHIVGLCFSLVISASSANLLLCLASPLTAENSACTRSHAALPQASCGCKTITLQAKSLVFVSKARKHGCRWKRSPRRPSPFGPGLCGHPSLREED